MKNIFLIIGLVSLLSGLIVIIFRGDTSDNLIDGGLSLLFGSIFLYGYIRMRKGKSLGFGEKKENSENNEM